jgi:prepilin-type N-terminal cleavage/methylation domain-containing protein
MKKNHGFTLIEILAVLGILALVAVAVTEIFLGTIKSQKKADTHLKLKEEGFYSLNYLRANIRNAQTATCVSDPTSLQVTNADGTITNYLVTDDKRLASQTGTEINKFLTSSSFEVTNLSFNCSTPSVNEPVVVSLNFTLNAPGTETESFQTTISLRNY